MPGALEIVAPMASRHDDSERLLIADGVLPIRQSQAPRPKGNRMPIALTGGCPSARRGVVGILLLLRDNASYSKTRGIRLEINWPSRIKMRKHWGLRKDITELCKRPDHHQGR